MRAVFVLSFITFSFAGLSQQTNLDCSNFKKGRFVVSPPTGDIIEIKRTKKFQKEKYNRKGKVHKFSIEWTSDCEYILKLVKTPSNQKDAYLGRGLFCKIVEENGDYYTCIIITPEHPEGRTCEVTKVR